ncbi:stability/ partitioning determinant [Providencia sp. wls1919]|nr:stability/ partitioning determinant [Providencia sp. wls1919]
MSIKLKVPKIPEMDKNEEQLKQGEKSRFINDGDRKPASNSKSVLRSFRLPLTFVDILDNEAEKVGQNNTLILKAALLGFKDLNSNDKNKLILEALNS